MTRQFFLKMRLGLLSLASLLSLVESVPSLASLALGSAIDFSSLDSKYIDLAIQHYGDIDTARSAFLSSPTLSALETRLQDFDFFDVLHAVASLSEVSPISSVMLSSVQSFLSTPPPCLVSSLPATFDQSRHIRQTGDEFSFIKDFRIESTFVRDLRDTPEDLRRAKASRLSLVGAFEIRGKTLRTEDPFTFLDAESKRYLEVVLKDERRFIVDLARQCAVEVLEEHTVLLPHLEMAITNEDGLVVVHSRKNAQVLKLAGEGRVRTSERPGNYERIMRLPLTLKDVVQTKNGDVLVDVKVSENAHELLEEESGWRADDATVVVQLSSHTYLTYVSEEARQRRYWDQPRATFAISKDGKYKGLATRDKFQEYTEKKKKEEEDRQKVQRMSPYPVRVTEVLFQDMSMVFRHEQCTVVVAKLLFNDA